MANTFKNDKERLIGTSEVSVYSVGNTSGHKTIVIGCSLANRKTNSITVDVLVYETDNSTSYYLVKDAPIPTGSSLEIMAGNKLVLNQDEEIRVKASEASAVDCLLSIMEIT
tara:strand:- start:684 stop:1019 length:336 start_codon:yes stop_codon:yes gene_type:complete